MRQLPPAEAEIFGLLRAHIRYFNVDRQMKLMVIVSAAPGDGKTTVARNLAMAAATVGSRVLYIEADLRRPVAARCFGIAGAPGLSEVLLGEDTLVNAVQTVDFAIRKGAHQGVDVLVAGGVLPPNPPQVIESHAMETLLDQHVRLRPGRPRHAATCAAPGRVPVAPPRRRSSDREPSRPKPQRRGFEAARDARERRRTRRRRCGQRLQTSARRLLLRRRLHLRLHAVRHRSRRGPRLAERLSRSQCRRRSSLAIRAVRLRGACSAMRDEVPVGVAGDLVAERGLAQRTVAVHVKDPQARCAREKLEYAAGIPARVMLKDYWLVLMRTQPPCRTSSSAPSTSSLIKEGT